MNKVLTTFALIIGTVIIAGRVFAATGTINTSDLNFRSKPSTDSSVIQKLNKGDKVDIISEDGDWYKISYNSKEGYVKKDYVDEDKSQVSENTNVVEEPATTDTTDASDSANTTNIKEAATIYILPLLNSTNLGVLQAGQKVTLISVNGNWAYIQTANMSGWVFTSKLEKTEITVTSSSKSMAETTKVEATENKQNTVTENTTNEDTENTVEVVEKTVEETKEPEESYPITMYVNVEDVNVRAKASSSATILTSLEKKNSVKVIGKEDNWYKIQTSGGTTGYIREDLLSK